MTKHVRIENADTSAYKVIVEVWERGARLEDGSREPDKFLFSHPLNHPTAMTEQTIWHSRYLVIREED